MSVENNNSNHLPAPSSAAGSRMPTTTIRPPSLPTWLDEWRIQEGPPKASSPMIRESLKSFHSALTPASREEIAAVLLTLVDMFGEPTNWRRKAELYFGALADLPLDLMIEAAQACIRDSEFFPKPAELRRCVEVEHRRRRDAKRKLQMALGEADRRREEQSRRQEAERRSQAAKADLDQWARSQGYDNWHGYLESGGTYSSAVKRMTAQAQEKITISAGRTKRPEPRLHPIDPERDRIAADDPMLVAALNGLEE